MIRISIPIVCFLFTLSLHAQIDSVEFENDLETFQSIIYDDTTQAKLIIEKWSNESLPCGLRTRLNNKKAVYAQFRKENDKALQLYKDSTLYLQRECLAKEDPDIANTYFNIAVLYWYRFGNKEEANKYYLNCLEHLEKYSLYTNTSADYYITFIARSILEGGDPEKAYYYWNLAKTLQKDSGDVRDKISYNELGANIFRVLGDLDLANTYLQNNLVLIEESGNSDLKKYNLPLQYYNLAYNNYLAENLDDAKKYILKADLIWKDTDQKQRLFSSNNILAIIAAKNKDESAAFHYFDKAIKYIDGNKQSAFIAENRGDLYSDIGKYENAIDEYNAALKLLNAEGSINQIDIFNLDPVVQVKGALAKSYYGLNSEESYVKAIQATASLDSLNALSINKSWLDQSILLAIGKSRDHYKWGLKALMKLPETKRKQYWQTAYKLISNPKAYLLKEEISRNRKLITTVPDSLLVSRKELEAKKNETAKFLAKHKDRLGPDSISMLEANILNNIREIEAFDKSLHIQYPEVSNDRSISNVSIMELQSTLPEDHLLLEYSVYEKSIFVLLISKNEISLHEKFNINLDELTLAEDIIPLTSVGDEIKTICIIPDGKLTQIPYEQLLTKEGRFLIEDYNLYYQYHNVEKGSSNKQFGSLVMGHDYVDANTYPANYLRSGAPSFTLGTLSNALQEANQVSQLIGGKAIEKTAITKKDFLSLAEGKSTIHLALHGMLNNQFPDQSGLIFPFNEIEDNYLSANDVYQLNLNNNLTVLSSCHSGEGSFKIGDAPRSLARSFLAAGSKNVLLSLWAAPDASTKKILIDFYQEAIKGNSFSVALSNAKRNYLRTASPSQRKPENWAHLILVGQDGFLPTEKPSFLIPALLSLFLVLILFLLKRRQKKEA